MLKTKYVLNQINETRQYYGLITALFNLINVSGKLEEATEQEDMNDSFDIKIGDDTRISIRIRNYGYNQRDFTIRKEEYYKLGYKPTKYYFYAWKDVNDDISEFMILDIERMQNDNLFKKQDRNWIPNGYQDTIFYVIDYDEFKPYIVLSELHNIKE